MEFGTGFMGLPMPTMRGFNSKAEAIQFAIEFTEDELNSIVATVGAYGGWTHTDYWVSLK